MLTTYEAILRGNILEWNQDVPQQLSLEQSVNVYVVFLGKTTDAKNQGPQMAAALSRLADLKSVDDLDALVWERETRNDNELEGRSE